MSGCNYDVFHKSAKSQKYIIKKNNYTYSGIIRSLEAVIIPGKRLNILDYGCGVGTISMYLGSLGHRITGLDISEKAIRTAKISVMNLGLKNVHFYTLGSKSLSHIREKFDLILLIEVIEHVPDDKQVIKEIADHLKINGHLILSTPSLNAPLYKAGLLKGFDRRVGHLRRYTEAEVKNLFKGTDISIETFTVHESILRNLLYTNPLCGWMLRFVKGPISELFILFEKPLVSWFGGSDYQLVGVKK